jgi:plasmid stability protein
MADMLIRGLSEELLAELDARAARLGISRVEYVRRRLTQDTAFATTVVEVADLHHFAETFADLADPAVLAEAWE